MFSLKSIVPPESRPVRTHSTWVRKLSNWDLKIDLDLPLSQQEPACRLELPDMGLLLGLDQAVFPHPLVPTTGPWWAAQRWGSSRVWSRHRSWPHHTHAVRIVVIEIMFNSPWHQSHRGSTYHAEWATSARQKDRCLWETLLAGRRQWVLPF